MLSPIRIDMNDEMKIDAATVRRLRESQAWSQEQLAAVAGISARTVQRVEGEGAASMETCMALAIAFGCLPADLMKPLPAAIEDATRSQDAGAEASGLGRAPNAWTSSQANAFLCMTTWVIVWVGIVLGSALIGPASSAFDQPMYDAFVWSLMVMFFVSVISTPGAMVWAAKRWEWPSRGVAFCERCSGLPHPHEAHK
jgi:transcriptional regulator with XRE-family HTH domain